jgi:hypothetical protein
LNWKFGKTVAFQATVEESGKYTQGTGDGQGFFASIEDAFDE